MFDKYWESMIADFIRYRGEVMNKAREIKTHMRAIIELQNEYLYIMEHRNEICEELREAVVRFFILGHVQNLYLMADVVMLFQDGRMMRINQFNAQNENHKTARKNYFHDQFTVDLESGESPVTLTLLSLDGFEFERLKLIRMYTNDQLICQDKVI